MKLLKGEKMNYRALVLASFLCLAIPRSFCQSDDQVKFEEAKQKNTVESYRAFIGEYPNSEYVEEAKNEIFSLRMDEELAPFSKGLLDQGWDNSWLQRDIKTDIAENLNLMHFLYFISQTDAFIDFEKNYDSKSKILDVVTKTDIRDIAFNFRIIDNKWVVRKVRVGYEEDIGERAAYTFESLLSMLIASTFEKLVE